MATEHTRNSRIFPWSEQTLPPLALACKHRTVESGEDKIELKRLHLILAAAADLPGARSFMLLLKQLVKDNYDQRHQVKTDPFSPILRHWQSAVPILYCGETLHVPGLEGGFGTHFSESTTLRFFGHLFFAQAARSIGGQWLLPWASAVWRRQS